MTPPLLAKPLDLEWIKITLLPAEIPSLSSLARLEPERSLICDGGLLHVLATDSQSLIPVQGESVSGFPGMEAPRSAGTGLVVSSDQVREVVRKDDAPSSLGSFSHTLPHAHLHGGNDFERFDLAQPPSLTFAVWGDRGTGWLGSSPFDPSHLQA